MGERRRADTAADPIEPLELPVRCSAACDVAASYPGGIVDATAALSHAGRVRLSLQPDQGPVAPRRGPLKVTLRWSAAGARAVSTRTVQLRLTRLPAPPLARLLDVRVRRGRNGVIDVRWRTDVPARDSFSSVIGTRTQDLDSERSPVLGGVDGGPRRRSFHVRLRDAQRVRYVHVILSQPVVERDRTVRLRVLSDRWRA